MHRRGGGVPGVFDFTHQGAFHHAGSSLLGINSMRLKFHMMRAAFLASLMLFVSGISVVAESQMLPPVESSVYQDDLDCHCRIGLCSSRLFQDSQILRTGR
jgi:hypothetical protein